MWNQEPHTQHRVRCTKGTSRAYCDADPGLVGPTATAAAVLLLEKLCCRCCTAVVVVAPATRSSCWTCHVRVVVFPSRKYYADFRGGKQETHKKNEYRVRITYVYVRVQRVRGLDPQAERTVTLTLASYVRLLLRGGTCYEK